MILQTAPQLWVSLGPDGYEITDAAYTTRVRVDLLTMEILSVANVPSSSESIVNWLSHHPRSAVMARINALQYDGFLENSSEPSELSVWWRRWGPEAHQLHTSCRRTRYLFEDDEVIAYKESLQADDPSPTEERESFLEGLPPRRCDELQMPGNYWDIIDRRRTASSHEGHPLPRNGLEQLVSATFAVRSLEQTKGLGVAAHKRYASAGGRHEISVFGINFLGQAEYNVMEYDDLRDTLTTLKVTVTRDELDAMTGGQYLAKGAAAAIILCTDLNKASWKYRGASGYRTSLLNVGFAGQLLLQNAAALGVTIRITDAVDGPEIGRRLGGGERLAPGLVFTLSGGSQGNAFPD